MRTVGPAEEWAELEVDSDTGEEEVNPSTGTGAEVFLDVSLYPDIGHETVGVTDGVRTDTGAREQPLPTGRRDVNTWTRVRARVMSTPAHWTCSAHVCLRCERIRNRERICIESSE